MNYHNVPEKIWKRLEPSSDGCLLWPGATGGAGEHRYGIAHFEPRSKLVLVHREMYRRVVGTVSEQKHVHHECGVTLCCNPLHLTALPIEQHIGQWHREKTHCPRGHAYDSENTHIRKSGWRECRTCGRERMRARRAALQPH